MIGDEYRNNAVSSKKGNCVSIGRHFFYPSCHCSFVHLVGIGHLWLDIHRDGISLASGCYHNILFIFLSRWSARIAYRHGLEARRLNQFALDLTAMPAFFAQELLDQGDVQFRIEGKKIIQAKASKMFGNIERFDEQHSHSTMELIWKWVTKKSETFGDNDINLPEEGTPKAKPPAKDDQCQPDEQNYNGS